MADGRLNKCIECTKSDVKKNYAATRDKRSQYESERSKLPERKKAVLEYQRRRRKKYPKKLAARRKVQYELSKGRLKKQPCEKCGKKKTEAHHSDYSKPLQINWLCRKCHLAEHGKILTKK